MKKYEVKFVGSFNDNAVATEVIEADIFVQEEKLVIFAQIGEDEKACCTDVFAVPVNQLISIRKV